jgi:hypothetical protein
MMLLAIVMLHPFNDAERRTINTRNARHPFLLRRVRIAPLVGFDRVFRSPAAVHADAVLLDAAFGRPLRVAAPIVGTRSTGSGDVNAVLGGLAALTVCAD